MPLLEESMPESTGGELAHAGQVEGEHVDGALEKLSSCELSYPLRQELDAFLSDQNVDQGRGGLIRSEPAAEPSFSTSC